ncbi:uncharacterized protein MELLADRAFT_55019 [Melampsora larici-populina 98AG31]|uniref:Uncharacterized protein n=1 Tax=Melampsora larici-populina (strain 98AG31 / pathotype 3-4-7) TaxID=747676 RepID=F4RA50_MELLP|nr:uncharacterized protein MELLADRAFT_55019 [Melampsora larici-populina 98AG31]EGG10843.1 hypothetical protein MELLADRAFT_55019 [Melampsora larici-populina 98AG31]
MATPNNLTKQTFVVKSHDEVDGCLSASSSYRFAKRVYLSIEVLKAFKICAGDLLMIKAVLKTDDIQKLSTLDETVSSNSSLLAFAIGVAWPSANLEKEMIVLSMDHLMTTSVAPGDLVSVIPLPPILPVDHRGPGKGIKLPEASSITLAEVDPDSSSLPHLDRSVVQLRPSLRSDGQLKVGRMWQGFMREVLGPFKYRAF